MLTQRQLNWRCQVNGETSERWICQIFLSIRRKIPSKESSKLRITNTLESQFQKFFDKQYFYFELGSILIIKCVRYPAKALQRQEILLKRFLANQNSSKGQDQIFSPEGSNALINKLSLTSFFIISYALYSLIKI